MASIVVYARILDGAHLKGSSSRHMRSGESLDRNTWNGSGRSRPCEAHGAGIPYRDIGQVPYGFLEADQDYNHSRVYALDGFEVCHLADCKGGAMSLLQSEDLLP